MGAGKTTVVSPLISLMLAQGDYLVMQCVPPALLKMSSDILRRTFSSTIQKRLYTFACDRATAGTQATIEKLRSAKESAAVVITTPPAIKSMFLKFVENLVTLTDPADRRYSDREIKAQTVVWSDVLGLLNAGVCIMDEVDLLLHPLKSELNFPIGDKHKLDFSPERWTCAIHALDAVFYLERKSMSVPFHSRPCFCA